MKLREQIAYGEMVVWEGRKDIRVSIFEAIFNPMLPFALLWLVFDLGFIRIFMSGFGEADMLGGGMMMGGLTGFFILHLMPVWIYLFGVITAGFKAKNTEYLITDKGIYIQSGIFTTVTEMKPFTDLSHVSVRQGMFDKMFGTGDVITVCSHVSMSQSSGHSHGMNIENIADYENVFHLVKEYQEAIYSDTMYPNDLRPEENHGYNTKYVR